MSGLCGSCRHWEHPRKDFRMAVKFEADHSDWTRENIDKAAERSDAEDPLFGLCRAMEMGCYLQMWQQTPLAVVNDGSGYKADLFTRAEFGCAMHEPAVRS